MPIFTLMRREFDLRVIGDTPEKIEKIAGEVVDWIVERNLKLWQDIQQYIDRRRLERQSDGLIGAVGSVQYNRQALLDSIERLAARVAGSYNREEEARKIANDVQGTLVVTLVAGAAADVTGILLATILGVGGLYLIRRKRRQANRNSPTACPTPVATSFLYSRGSSRDNGPGAGVKDLV